MRMCFRAIVVSVMAISMGTVALAGVPNFDDLSLSGESYWNGSDFSGGFNSGPAFFNNSFTDWGGGAISWEGFAYSNLSQQSPALNGMAGQYTAITGSAESGNNYAIGFVGWAGLPTMSLAEPMQLDRA